MCFKNYKQLLHLQLHICCMLRARPPEMDVCAMGGWQLCMLPNLHDC
jgi:hypothetical protein